MPTASLTWISVLTGQKGLTVVHNIPTNAKVSPSDAVKNFSLPLNSSLNKQQGPSLKFYRRSLQNEGFHRDVRTDAVLMMPAWFGDQENVTYCDVAVLEILPESVFVDTYQVEEIHRLGYGYSSMFFFTFLSLSGAVDREPLSLTNSTWRSQHPIACLTKVWFWFRCPSLSFQGTSLVLGQT